MYLLPKPFFRRLKTHFSLCISIAEKEKGDTIPFGDYVTFIDNMIKSDNKYRETKKILNQQRKDSVVALMVYGLKFDGKVKYIFKPLGNLGTNDPLNQRGTLGWRIKGEIII